MRACRLIVAARVAVAVERYNRRRQVCAASAIMRLRAFQRLVRAAARIELNVAVASFFSLRVELSAAALRVFIVFETAFVIAKLMFLHFVLTIADHRHCS